MVTKLKGQLLHLHPEKAELLNQLAAETRIPKSVLMREAIDDLLAKHGKYRENAWYSDIAATLKAAVTVANRYRSMTNEAVWQAKCEEVRKRANELLASMGRK